VDRRSLGCLFEVLETLVLTLVIFFVIQTFIAQPFQVQQHSMERTFVEGDYVLVDRLSHLWNPYGHGQVVVFAPPESWTTRKEPYIKRVIGVGGDTVEVRDGAVFVNGEALDEPYLYRDADGVAEPVTQIGSAERHGRGASCARLRPASRRGPLPFAPASG
jgi:signal peptidase I